MLTENGQAWVWGSNGTYGALGDGGVITTTIEAIPIYGLSNVTSISTGAEHSLALMQDGTVWAWGRNNNGQLGDGTKTNRLTPVQVPNLSGIVAISAGGVHSLAIKDDGTVWSWGYNYDGQLGDGTNGPNGAKSTPAQMSGLSGIVAVEAGINYSLALKSDGTVWVCGVNSAGQLGIGSTTSVKVPTQIAGLGDVVAISAQGYHSLALKSDGSIWAWGNNANFRLGDNTTTNGGTSCEISWANMLFCNYVTHWDRSFRGSYAVAWIYGTATSKLGRERME